MSKVDLKFLDMYQKGSHISIDANYINHHKDDRNIRILGSDISGGTNSLEDVEVHFDVWLDVSTAIKLVKTLRTKINEIKEASNV
jgi:hypothetical protein